MANPKHLAKLKQGVKAWNEWRAESHTEHEGEADLSGANLSEANLTRAELTWADLSGADLSEANLTRAELTWADLSGVDLSTANLSEANLTAANLSEANLTRADLTGAGLSEANLTRADLTGANLSEANLTRADLTGANLTGADLMMANFSRTVLATANLRGAACAMTIFAGNDLSQVLGLDGVRHVGPSSIGLDTVFTSKGAIPDVFLRGAGVPEIFITYQSSMLEKPIQFYSCFISYSHSNKAFARRLHDALQGRGIRCWLDEHELLPGDDVHDGIDRGIRLWDKVVLCASETSLTSWWVDKELDKAFQKEEQLWRDRKKKVLALIPLDLDGYLFSGKWTSGKASLVTSRLAGNFAGWESDNAKFERELERVVKALRTDNGRLPPPPKLL